MSASIYPELRISALSYSYLFMNLITALRKYHASYLLLL